MSSVVQHLALVITTQWQWYILHNMYSAISSPRVSRSSIASAHWCAVSPCICKAIQAFIRVLHCSAPHFFVIPRYLNIAFLTCKPVWPLNVPNNSNKALRFMYEPSIHLDVSRLKVLARLVCGNTSSDNPAPLGRAGMICLYFLSSIKAIISAAIEEAILTCGHVSKLALPFSCILGYNTVCCYDQYSFTDLFVMVKKMQRNMIWRETNNVITDNSNTQLANSLLL